MPVIRSPLFVFRLVVGLVLTVIGIGVLAVFDHALLGLQEDIASLQGGWPSWLPHALELGIGSLVLLAFLTAVAVLLVRRRPRQALLLVLTVLVAFSLSSATTALVEWVSPSKLLLLATKASSPDAELGNKALTSIVALLTLTSPWIGRRIRPWVIGIALLGYSLSFVGDAAPVLSLPFDIGVGIVSGALVALVFKTYDRTPTPEQLAVVFEGVGTPVASIRRASVDARGSVPWLVETADGRRLFVKTLGTDQRAADLMFRLYRWIRLRHAGDRRPFASLERAVEHEALLSLAAHARGIRTPLLEVAAEIGTDGMVLAYERIDGRSLDEVPAELVTDELLAEVWRLVGSLADSDIAHRDLRLANVFVESTGTPWLIDFGFAELAAPPDLLARDVAELLGSTSVVVGPERAVAAAIGTLGPARIESALPWIQPLALSTATRSQLGRNKGFERLRAAASAALGIDEVSYEKIERFSAKTAITIVTLALTAYILIPQFAQASGFLQELIHADPLWTGVAAVASAITYVAAAIGLIGAIPMRLGFGSVLAAQLASSFANRITPAKVGGMATNVRFLQKRSIPPSTAISAVGLNTLAGFVVHVTLLIGIGVLAGSSSQVSLPIPSGTTALIVVGGLILLSGVLMALPMGRKLMTKNLIPAIRTAGRSIASVARTPSKVVALFAGSAMVTLMYTVAMLASLAAFGSTLGVVTAAFVYLAGAAVATAAPTPGGVGATEAALVAGYTAVGVDPTVAFAAVLLFRFVTFWLPILPGYVALGVLRRRGDL